MYYCILHKFGPEWDGQDLVFIKSKALFDTIVKATSDIYWDDFSEELKQEILEKHRQLDYEAPYDVGPVGEDTDLNAAIEYLKESPKFPITVLDVTELYSDWNW